MKIMVVEDEPPILRDICAHIQAQGGGHTICAQVGDGGLAIDAIRAGKLPDLVITDVRMPVVDGMQLTAWLRAEHPEVQVVVLTGYQEFEYARSALRLGVADYLLKPVKPESLGALLARIDAGLAERHGHKRYRAIEDAWLGLPPERGADVDADAAFCIVLAGAGSLTETGEDIMLPGAGFWEKADAEDRLDKLVGTDRFWIVEGQSSTERLILLDLADRPLSSLEQAVDSIFEWLSSSGLPIFMAACMKPMDLPKLRPGYSALKRTIAQRAVLGRSCLIKVASLEPQGPAVAPLMYDPDKETLIAKAASEGGADLLAAGLKSLFADWERACLPLGATERYLNTLVTHLQSLSPAAPAFCIDIDFDIRYALAGALNFDDLVEPVASLIRAVTGECRREADSSDELVKEAEAYLRRHYTESISGEQLSKKIGIVPSYLSKLFKKHTGFSPPEFIIKLRMEHACELLDQSDDVLIKDVARIVGYEDPNHFSRTFHKVCGYWPSEHRRHSGEAE
jgi:two-component system, response regulator YesN